MFGLPAWAVSIIAVAAVPIVGQLLLILLPNKGVTALGYTWGRFITVFFRQKIGTKYESGESYFQGTLDAFVAGIHKGLNSDD